MVFYATVTFSVPRDLRSIARAERVATKRSKHEPWRTGLALSILPKELLVRAFDTPLRASESEHQPRTPLALPGIHRSGKSIHKAFHAHQLKRVIKRTREAFPTLASLEQFLPLRTSNASRSALNRETPSSTTTTVLAHAAVGLERTSTARKALESPTFIISPWRALAARRPTSQQRLSRWTLCASFRAFRRRSAGRTLATRGLSEALFEKPGPALGAHKAGAARGGAAWRTPAAAAG